MYTVVKGIKQAGCDRGHFSIGRILCGPYKDVNIAYKQCQAENTAYIKEKCGCVAEVVET